MPVWTVIDQSHPNTAAEPSALHSHGILVGLYVIASFLLPIDSNDAHIPRARANAQPWGCHPRSWTEFSCLTFCIECNSCIPAAKLPRSRCRSKLQRSVPFICLVHVFSLFYTRQAHPRPSFRCHTDAQRAPGVGKCGERKGEDRKTKG